MPKNKKNKFRSAQHKIHKFLKRFPSKTAKAIKISALVLVTLALTVLVYMGEQAGVWFKASVLEAPQPFNGTTLPVTKVPNYTYWSTQKSLRYEQISESDLIDLPAYDLTKMQFPDDQLVWGDSSQNSIRNAKITYAVVYLGNYKYDHKESAGSHLAVDIKIPSGTPVHAIANGKVDKVSLVSTGFGHHVVIKHTNVPDPENPGKFTTLFSAYNHMDRIDVNEGENVLKGKIIGTSGNTGTSTTPHLHFQIDRLSAPWHPYWPFTWQESQAAGLSFFEAVNAGLGLSRGKTYTINPMQFVFKNLNYNAVASTENTAATNTSTSTDDTDDDTTGTNTTASGNTTTSAATTTTTESTIGATSSSTGSGSSTGAATETQPEFTESNPSKLFTYKITGDSVGMVDTGVTLTISDESKQTDKLSNDEVIYLELTGVGKLLKEDFKKSDFVNGSIKLTVKSSETGTANVTIGKSSHQISFIDEMKMISKFRVDSDGYFQKNIVETVKVVALDEDGNVTPAVNFAGVANVTSNIGGVRITPSEFESRDFRNGVAEVKVIVSNDGPVIIKAQNGALVGEGTLYIEDDEVFSDIKLSHANYEAIKYLKDKDIIKGYDDGTFRPDQTVNRAEALKMLMLTFNVDVGGPFELNFTDVDKSAWYASTLSSAVARGIVKGYDDGTFKPSSTVNRAEYLKILFATNSIKPNSEITKPYDDVELSDWFAGYAFLANKMNILDPAKRFAPENGMTRAMVAETIYRMKMIQDNNLVTYSK